MNKKSLTPEMYMDSLPALKLAVFDDDPLFCDQLREGFRDHFQVHIFHSFTKAVETVQPEFWNQFDIAMIDVHMPSMSGYVFARDYWQNLAPPGSLMFFISNDDTPENRVAGLKLKPEDFLTKSMSFEEMHLRIQNRLEQSAFIFLDFSIQMDPTTLQAKLQNEHIVELTKMEWSLLLNILRGNGIASRKDLTQRCWNVDHISDTAFRTQIHRLNKSIEDSHYVVRYREQSVVELVPKESNRQVTK